MVKDRRVISAAYDGPDRREIQYVTVEAYDNGAATRLQKSERRALVHTLIQLAQLAVIFGAIFAGGTFVGRVETSLAANTSAMGDLAVSLEEHTRQGPDSIHATEPVEAQRVDDLEGDVRRLETIHDRR